MIFKTKYHDELKKWAEGDDKKIQISGLIGSARSYFLSQFFIETNSPFLIILPSAKEAQRLYRELEFFLPKGMIDSGPGYRRLYDFPPYDISPLTGLSPHRNVVNRRIQALYALISGKDPIVITSAEACMFKVLTRQEINNALEYIEAGEALDRENLIKKLEQTGYMRNSLVEDTGDYSVRGGVLDIFTPLYDQPIRMEFWGDQVESIRYFDPISQRSTGDLKEIIILPANEIIMAPVNMKRARSMGRLPGQGSEGTGFPGQEAWLNHFYDNLDSIFDYFPINGITGLIDRSRLDAEQEKTTNRFINNVEKYRVEKSESGSVFPETQGLILSSDEIQDKLLQYRQMIFSELSISDGKQDRPCLNIKTSSEIDVELEVRMQGKGRVSLAPLAQRIADWSDQGSMVILVCRTEQQAERLKEILLNYKVEVHQIARNWHDISMRSKISVCLGRLSKGFSWPEIGMHVVSEDEIFGPKRSRSVSRKGKGESALDWTSFSQLKVGDLVVHQDHGIGRYGGLVKMEIEEKVNDFVVIEYEGNDRLYTPADRISIIQKYVGADQTDPKLDKLGGRSWNVTKQKAKKSVMEIAKQLVEIYALRKYRKGFAFSRPDNYFREFEASFEHEETPDQIKAIEDVLSDMEADQPMDRLICGDVGFGKTEIAVRASFKAVMDGKQVAVLVPTTVLAEQHYETFRGRMAPYGIKVGVLSRFKRRAEQKEIIAKVRSGKTDILIGTHRLLQKDIGFKDFGLLVIDEEQRFGVKQKERLKKIRALVDVLALTATPIPRTLHLSLMGVRDLSIIETPPEDRLAIQTYLSPYDESMIKEAINTEIERGGQIFFVHNRVITIDRVAENLRELVPKARFAIAHGQLMEKELEQTMVRFLRKEIDVLVCTTIIESGLDIPSANTIIINEADRLGMAQIYQLRGRVGRSSENAYAYLLLSNESKLTRQAEKRLKALIDYSQLGAGINLAMHDLKIRGGGNILGFTQSGHISAIGYELYINMVEKAIAELKGEDWHEDVNPEINVDIPAYLPEEYVSDIDVRLNLYRRLSGLRKGSDLEAIEMEMTDRFGQAPEAVRNLLKIMEIRLGLKSLGIDRLDIKQDYLLFNFSPNTMVSPENIIEFMGSKKNRFRFISESRLKVSVFTKNVMESLSQAKDIIRVLSRNSAYNVNDFD